MGIPLARREKPEFSAVFHQCSNLPGESAHSAGEIRYNTRPFGEECRCGKEIIASARGGVM